MHADTGISALTGLIPSSGSAVTLVSDTFTDTGGTNLTAHTPDIRPGSNAWVAVAGTIDIQANKAQGENSANQYYSIDAGQADVTISADVTPSATTAGSWGISGRISDASNSWDVTVNASAGSFRLYEHNAGVYTIRASAAVTINNGTAYTLAGQFSGQNVTATINGGNQISYGSATLNQSTTKHGLNVPTAWTADNFKVTNP